MSITGLERELHHYTLEPSDTAFDLKSVPLAAQPVTEQAVTTPGELPSSTAAAAVKTTTEKVAATRQDVYAGQLPSFCYSKLQSEIASK